MTWLTHTEDDIRIDVKSGYSLLPGRIHLEGFRMQFKDYNVEMAIQAEEADASLALLSLARKRIHVHWVRASGVEYRMLHRVKDRKKSAARLAAFPDIAAFDRPPYYDAPRSPRSKNPWSLHVDSIEADAHFVWVMEYRLRGKLRATGGFYTDPLHEAEVFPCHVGIRDGTVFVGDEQIAHEVKGAVSFALEPFKVRDAPIEEVLPKISARFDDLSARIDTLSFTKLYHSTDPVDVEGRGQLEIDSTVTRGKLEKGSRASLMLSPLVISAHGEGDEARPTARGVGRISLLVPAERKLDAKVHAELPPAESGSFSVKALSAQVALESEDIRAFHPRRVQLDVENLHYDEPEFLNAVFGKGTLLPVSGTFNFHGSANLPKEQASRLEAKLETLSTSFFVLGKHFGATTETSASCRGTLDAADCRVDFHAPYLLVDDPADDEEEALWLRVLTPSPLDVNAKGGTFEGPFVVSGGDPKDAVSEWLGEEWLAQLGLKLVPTGQITGSFTAKRTPAEFSLSKIDIATGKTRLEGRMTAGETLDAIGTLDMPVGRFGFETTPDGPRLRPFVGRQWQEKQ